VSPARRHRTRARAGRGARDPLTAPVRGARRHRLGGVIADVVRVANGRVKRIVYPPGFRWSTHMQPVVGTPLCQHAHVGFLVRGRVRGSYRDGCAFSFSAPQAVVIEPGHDAWVVGDDPAVLIEFDAEAQTAARFGLPAEHRH
jgi:hypothetical protein